MQIIYFLFVLLHNFDKITNILLIFFYYSILNRFNLYFIYFFNFVFFFRKFLSLCANNFEQNNDSEYATTNCLLKDVENCFNILFNQIPICLNAKNTETNKNFILRCQHFNVLNIFFILINIKKIHFLNKLIKKQFFFLNYILNTEFFNLFFFITYRY